jgi:hypothetical protein
MLPKHGFQEMTYILCLDFPFDRSEQERRSYRLGILYSDVTYLLRLPLANLSSASGHIS